MGVTRETDTIASTSKKFDNIHGLPLKEHLKLLAAFKQLRTRVQGGEPHGAHSGLGGAHDAPPPYSKEDGAGRAAPQLTSLGKSSSAEPANGSKNTSDGETRWTEFLTRALFRFDQWLRVLLAPHPRAQARHALSETALADLRLEPFKAHPMMGQGPFLNAAQLPPQLLPPLDVALIWHSYMLNPARYIDDAMRIHESGILSCFQFPLREVVRMLTQGKSGLEYNAPSDAVALFESKLKMPFDPFTAMRTSSSTLVKCPRLRCKRATHVSYSDLCQDPNWSKKCPSCSQLINANTCKGARFLRDLESWCDSTGTDRSGFRLRGGTLSTRDARPFFKDPFHPLLDRIFASRRTRTALSADTRNVAIWTPGEDILGRVKSGTRNPQEVFRTARDINEIAEVFLATALQVVPNKLFSASKYIDIVRVRTDMLMRHYISSHPLTDFSVDLVAAARRQEKFIDEMDNLGWLNNVSSGVLHNSTNRYTKWLSLLVSHPNSFLSPTLDIDLVWHTHQLSHVYYTDCFLIIGRFLDHDDKVEKGDLKAAFQRTTDLWTKQFGQPYSLCGCCRPQQEAGLARVAGTLRAKFRKGKGKEIIEDQDCVKEGRDGPDHPSVHNAVTILGYSQGGEDGETETGDELDKKTATAHGNAFDTSSMTPFYYIPCAEPHAIGQGMHPREGKALGAAAPCAPGDTFHRPFVNDPIELRDPGGYPSAVPIFGVTGVFGMPATSCPGGAGCGGGGGGGCGGGGCGGGGCS